MCHSYKRTIVILFYSFFLFSKACLSITLDMREGKYISGGEKHICLLDALGIQCWIKESGEAEEKLKIIDAQDPSELLSSDGIQCFRDRRGMHCWEPGKYEIPQLIPNIAVAEKLHFNSEYYCLFDKEKKQRGCFTWPWVNKKPFSVEQYLDTQQTSLSYIDFKAKDNIGSTLEDYLLSPKNYFGLTPLQGGVCYFTSFQVNCHFDQKEIMAKINFDKEERVFTHKKTICGAKYTPPGDREVIYHLGPRPPPRQDELRCSHFTDDQVTSQPRRWYSHATRQSYVLPENKVSLSLKDTTSDFLFHDVSFLSDDFLCYLLVQAPPIPSSYYHIPPRHYPAKREPLYRCRNFKNVSWKIDATTPNQTKAIAAFGNEICMTNVTKNNLHCVTPSSKREREFSSFEPESVTFKLLAKRVYENKANIFHVVSNLEKDVPRELLIYWISPIIDGVDTPLFHRVKASFWNQFPLVQQSGFQEKIIRETREKQEVARIQYIRTALSVLTEMVVSLNHYTIHASDKTKLSLLKDLSSKIQKTADLFVLEKVLIEGKRVAERLQSTPSTKSVAAATIRVMDYLLGIIPFATGVAEELERLATRAYEPKAKLLQFLANTYKKTQPHPSTQNATNENQSVWLQFFVLLASKSIIETTHTDGFEEIATQLQHRIDLLNQRFSLQVKGFAQLRHKPGCNAFALELHAFTFSNMSPRIAIHELEEAKKRILPLLGEILSQEDIAKQPSFSSSPLMVSFLKEVTSPTFRALLTRLTAHRESRTQAILLLAIEEYWSGGT